MIGQQEKTPVRKYLARISRRILIPFIALAGIALSQTGFAQGDGPRAYQLVPEGTQSIGQFLFALRGNNAPGDGIVHQSANLDINLGATQYARAMDLNGHQAGLLAVIPYGNASGSVDTLTGTVSGSD